VVEVATAPQAEEHLEQRHVVAAAMALVVEPIDRVRRLHVGVARVAERHEVPRLLLVLAVRPALGIGDDVRRDDIGQQWRQHRWRRERTLRQAAQARVLDQRALVGSVAVHIEARPHRAAEITGDRRPLILCPVWVRKGTPRAFAAGLEYAGFVERCVLGHDSNARLVLVVLEQVLKEVVSHATHDLGCLNRGEGTEWTGA
jgi:hypothetical protein